MERKKMTLQQLLIDYTNYLWKPTSRDGEYGWFEMEHDLDVRARATDKSAKPGILIYNKDGGDKIELTQDQYKYLDIAMQYAQLNDGGELGRGSAEQFWAYAKAYDKLGGDYAFGGCQDGIYCHVGERGVFCDYQDGVYDLFLSGCHAYAATPGALLGAYYKVLGEVELWDRLKAGNEVAATES